MSAFAGAPRRGLWGTLGLVAAVCVVLTGTALVLIVTESSPPPGTVLSAARSYTAHTRSLTYAASETTSAPAGDGTGALLVRSRSVKGGGLADGTSDFSVVLGQTALEYRAVAGDDGVWVRGAAAAFDLPAASWIHAGGFAGFEAALLRNEGVTSPGSGDVARAALLDTLSGGRAVRDLVAAARTPHRDSARVRTLDVAFDSGVLGGGADATVRAFTGQLTVDSHDHPTALAVHLEAAQTTIDVTYTVRWNTPLSIPVPAAGDVGASI